MSQSRQVRRNEELGVRRLELTRISGHTFLGSGLSSTSNVLDLGANHGAFARSVQQRWGCRIHSVEPTPSLARALETIQGVEVYRTAVSEAGGELLFRVDPCNSESSSIVSRPDEHTTAVSGTTLAALAERVGPIDLLKMDVEGAEVGILDSAPEPLLSTIPQLTVEFHDFKPSAGISAVMVRRVLSRMRSIGFHVFVNSFWTFGDVLFVNRRLLPLSTADRCQLSLRGRWLPGLQRIARRGTGRIPDAPSADAGGGPRS